MSLRETKQQEDRRLIIYMAQIKLDQNKRNSTFHWLQHVRRPPMLPCQATGLLNPNTKPENIFIAEEEEEEESAIHISIYLSIYIHTYM